MASENIEEAGKIAEPEKEASSPAVEPEKEASSPAVEPEKEASSPAVEPEKEASSPAVEPEKETSSPAVKPETEAAPAAAEPVADAAPPVPEPEKKAGDAGAPAEAAEPAGEAQAPVADRRPGKLGKGRVSSVGIVHVKATFSNTMVTITDTQGAVISWSSGGRAGFKGSRKSTAFTATMVGQEAARQAVGRGMREAEVRVQGAGAGRESAVRALQAAGMTVTAIKDVTPVPHNGCRPCKRRRV